MWMRREMRAGTAAEHPGWFGVAGCDRPRTNGRLVCLEEVLYGWKGGPTRKDKGKLSPWIPMLC